jgi:hypothetical protein
VHTEHQTAHFEVRRPKRSHQIEPPCVIHRDVSDDEIGLQLFGETERGSPATGFSNYLNRGLDTQTRPYTRAHEFVVIDEDDSDVFKHGGFSRVAMTL